MSTKKGYFALICGPKEILSLGSEYGIHNQYLSSRIPSPYMFIATDLKYLRFARILNIRFENTKISKIPAIPKYRILSRS